MLEALRCLWSPQQIAKHLKHKGIEGIAMTIRHTTIYATLRALPQGDLKKELLSCLRRDNKRYRCERP